VWEKVQAGFSRQPLILTLQNWRPDHWIAQGCAATKPGFDIGGPVWALVEGLDRWPVFGMDNLLAELGVSSRSVRHDRVAALLGAATPLAQEQDPVAEFHQLLEESAQFRDVAQVQANRVRAWLKPLSVISSPVLRLPQMLRINSAGSLTSSWIGSTKRFEWSESIGRLAANDGVDLNVLYNARVDDGGVVSMQHTRVGQSMEWRWHSSWLAHPISCDDTLATVRLTGRLLQSPAVLTGLYAALARDDPALDRLALCVLRRWLLALQALTWLDDALQRQWRWARPEDLVTFAFAALRPSWPRPLVAISHRSGDAKPTLQRLGMWRSPVASIDASFVPSWEMNVGMIWGLFAAIPVIVRVHTPTYADSEWCNREWEITEYLAEQSDFLHGRHVFDVPVEGLDRVDGLVRRAGALFNPAPAELSTSPDRPPLPPFPPASLVLMAPLVTSGYGDGPPRRGSSPTLPCSASRCRCSKCPGGHADSRSDPRPPRIHQLDALQRSVHGSGVADGGGFVLWIAAAPHGYARR
jgi:hypothetical protein